MKKLVAVLLCMTIILTFGACSSKEKVEDKPKVEEKVLTIEEAINSIDGLTDEFDTVESDYAMLNFTDTYLGGLNSVTSEKLNEFHKLLGFSDALLVKLENTEGTDENKNYRVTWTRTERVSNSYSGTLLAPRVSGVKTVVHTNVVYEMK